MIPSMHLVQLFQDPSGVSLADTKGGSRHKVQHYDERILILQGILVIALFVSRSALEYHLRCLLKRAEENRKSK